MKRGQIVALIPARSGSKSVPEKNILPLGNYPLLAYSIAAGLASKYIDEVIVSTDSDKYAQIARSYGATVPFLRPENISCDDSTDIEFFIHYLDYLMLSIIRYSPLSRQKTGFLKVDSSRLSMWL